MLKAMMSRINPRRVVGSLFPIVQWSKSYDVETAIGDFIAGITVALTLIPQAIAYASLAGFEPQYGLYASLVGGFVYAVMGTCPQINIGPTALLSLLTFTYTHETSTDFAVLLCFISGIVQLIAGVARLGFLVEFVSLPVVSGFTSAAALTIASSQIKGLLGLRFDAETFVATWSGVFTHIGDTRLSDTLLGLACCIILMGMKALKDIPVKADSDESGGRSVYLKKTFWFTAVSRNAVVVVGAAIVAYCIHRNRNEPLILTGNITPGLPKPQVPPFKTTVGNITYTAGDMFAHLGSGLLVVPLVGIISNIAIAKAFSTGKALDATQEIVALGACNVVSAFFTSYPVNGSFSRSAVSDASGVKTPAAGFYTGVIVLLTLVLLTPYFYFIPRSALAAVIVSAVLNMVDVAILKKLWITSRLDIIPLMGTFILCLGLGVEIGLICGIGIDAILLLYYHSRPPLDVKYVDDGNLPPHYVIYPVGGLHFAGAEGVRTKLLELRNPQKNNTPLIVLESLTIRPDSDNLTNANISSNDRGNDNNAVEMNYRRESENRVINQEGSVNIGMNGNITGSITGNVRVESTGRKSANILVINCSALYRMDYTFLQSVKMLVLEWSKSGHVIWCDVKAAMKEQLDSVLHNPLYCESENLNSYLTRLTFPHTPQPHVARDTRL